MNQLQALNYFINHDYVMATSSPEQRSRLLNAVIVEKIDAEQIVFKQNSTTDYIYFLIEGEIVLGQHTINLDKVLIKSQSTIDAHQYFGLQALLPGQRHVQTATTVQPSIIIKIPVTCLQTLMADNNTVTHYFMTMLMPTKIDMIPANVKNQLSQQTNLFSSSIIYAWMLSSGLPTILYMVLHFFNVNQSLNIFSCTALFGIMAWSSNIMPPYVCSIFVLIGFLATGIVPSTVALSGFACESFIVLFCLYALFGAILSSGLAHRILLLALQYLPTSQWWMNMFLFVIGFFLTNLVPEATERHKFSAPILIDLINFTKLKPGSSAVTRLIVSSFNGSYLFSSIFYHGSIYNFLLLGTLLSQDQEKFRWDGWFEAALVPGIIMFMVQSIIISCCCYHSTKLDFDRSRINVQKLAYGRLTVKEWIVICAASFLVIGLSTINFHRMTPLSIYLLMFVILTFTRMGDDIVNHEKINWSPLLLFASLLGVIMSAHYLQLNIYIVAHLDWLGVYIKNNFTIFILILSLLSALIRLFLSYGLTVIILTSILVPVAQVYEVNGWLICFICLTTAKIWFFPYQSPAYQELKVNLGHIVQFDEAHFIYHNAVLNICQVIVLLLSQYYWIKLGLL